jgi:hypothetical protein
LKDENEEGWLGQNREGKKRRVALVCFDQKLGMKE